jgi:hypothetical protein
MADFSGKVFFNIEFKPDSRVDKKDAVGQK